MSRGRFEGILPCRASRWAHPTARMAIAARERFSGVPFGFSRLAKGFPKLRFDNCGSRKALRTARMAIATREGFSDASVGFSRLAMGCPTLRWGFRVSRWVVRRSGGVFASRDGLSDAPAGFSRLATIFFPFVDNFAGKELFLKIKCYIRGVHY